MQIRPLLLAWFALMALTAIAGFAADVGSHARLGALPVVVVAMVAVVKARLILARYLHLAAFPGFLTGFTLAFLLVMVITTGTLVATP